MTCTTCSPQYQTWTKGEYMISTDPSLIPVRTLNAAFASEIFYWANPLPEDVMLETLRNSLCFGLYKVTEPNNEPSATSQSEATFIGLARCVTDRTTFIYLTDVYVDPSHQGKGLGAWLITCVQEVIDTMPYLRRSMLFTSNWNRSVPFYERLMGMDVVECRRGEGVGLMIRKGPGVPDVSAVKHV